MTAKRAKRGFGSVRKLPSGRFQARYLAPDGNRYPATADDGSPLTFDTKTRAERYLERISGEIQRGTWLPPVERQRRVDPQSFRSYSEAWLATRELADRTRQDYSQILRDHVWPTFAETDLASITPLAVRTWHAKLATGPTMKAHAYSLLRTVMGTAVSDEIVAANPCRIRGAGNTKRVKAIRPASLPELETIAASVPARYKLMILLAAWCALRFGELAELRRSDINVKDGTIDIRRGVVRTKTGHVVKGPKSEAGKRLVHIPPHLLPAVRDHLAAHVPADQDALIFPARNGSHMQPSALQKVYYPARAKAGRTDLRFHDLRHTGATLAAATGATLAELMARLGHSTVSAALRYQHAASDRDKTIAQALSGLVGDATVTPISAARTSGSA